MPTFVWEPAPLAKLVRKHYPPLFHPSRLAPLGSGGGFSGARLWRATTEAGEFGLRRWPREHPSPERLAWIHATLGHVVRQGVGFVAAPVPTLDGGTFFSADGHLLELAPWLPGEAAYRRAPSEEKLRNCLEALALFHRAAATSPAGPVGCQTSPGLLERRRLLGELLGGELERLRGAIRRPLWPAGYSRAVELLSLFPRVAPDVASRLEYAVRLVVPIQPCLRDVWHDHLLFQGDRLSGLLDYGAMRGESVAGDLARLLGSLVGDDQNAWRRGLEQYARLRPLSPDERSLVRTFDESGVLLSGVSWLQWIYQEHRQFDDLEAVALRLDEFLRRLSRAV